MVLEVVPRMMNALVVQLMSGDTHCSNKVLEGYCAFHHMMLVLCTEYPDIRREVDRRVGDFMGKEGNRAKSHTPNLGELLCLLSCSSTSWADICEVMVREVMDRN